MKNKHVRIAALVGALLCNFCLRAAESSDPARAQHAIELYESAWHEHDDARRAALLAEGWAKKGVFKDPNGVVTGRAALSQLIGKFHKDFPHANGTRTSRVDVHGSSFRFAWKIVFAPDGQVLEGVDFGELSADGRIASITGFWQPLPTTESVTNQAVVIAYLEALFKTGDLAALDKLVAPAAVYTQASGLPYGGTYVGVDQWRQMFIKSTTFFDVLAVTAPDLASNAAGDRIVASFQVKFRSKATGKESLQPIQEQFRLADGKIVAVTPSYFDTKALVDTMR